MYGKSLQDRPMLGEPVDDEEINPGTPEQKPTTPTMSPKHPALTITVHDDDYIENPFNGTTKTPQPPTIFYKGKNARQFLNFQDPRLEVATASTKQLFFLYMIHSLKFLLSTLGSLVFWVGLWDFYETYWFPYTLATELSLTFVGMFLYFLLILIFKIPIIDRLEHRRGWIGTIVRNIRDTAAIFLCIAVWKGGYNLLDIYVFEYSWTRSGIYCAVGFFFMTITGGLKSNVNI
jgi:hypothetical protein